MSVVFTNGCFDIIHRGHIELLEFCSTLGTKVIVGLNSDKSIKSLKGKERPVNNQSDRKLLLEAIKYVDSVIVFEEETPYNLICKIKPDIIVKGGDYKAEDVVGADIAKVKIFDHVKGYSTTNSIQNITNR